MTPWEKIRARCAELATVECPDVEARQAEAAAERRREVVERAARSACIPTEFAKASIGTLRGGGEKRVAIDGVRGIVMGGFKSSQGIFGDIGVGKSYLHSAVGNAAIEAGLKVRMFTPTEIFARLTGAESYAGTESVIDVLRDLASARVTIFDDFGSELLITRRSLAYLFEIVKRITASDGTLLINSNRGFDDLHGMYAAKGVEFGDERRGTAIMDRIRAKTGKWLEIRGKSERVFRGEA
jgi:DNA replication protein DnaC